jgi:Xaa-Pro aminopeptidase
MLTSNEPGFYKTGAYGIRIENLVLCVEAEATEFGQFLQFETLSLFPIDTTLMDPDLLTNEEKTWLNDYHRRVLRELESKLEPAEVEWLKSKCDQVI